jgi:dephospho-CoA kinase
MFTVALTGGIASGKSTVACCFAKLGISVIDADEIAHRLVNLHPAVLQQIVDSFGQSVLTEDKRLNRSRLRDIVFCNSEDRVRLEQILHPLIYKEIQSSFQTVKSVYCLLVIPLLLEERTISLLKKKSDSGIELNRILLVTTTKELQFQRAYERDHIEKKQIEAILSAQIPPAKGLTQADDIIYNKTTLNDLNQSVERFHHMYLSFSRAKNIVLEQSAFLRYYLTLK